MDPQMHDRIADGDGCPCAPSPLLPDTHRVRTEVETEACVANEQRRDPRGHRSRHRETVDEPTSNERIRQGTDRMPESAAMPDSQVSSPRTERIIATSANRAHIRPLSVAMTTRARCSEVPLP